MTDPIREKLAAIEELRPNEPAADPLNQAILVGYHLTCEWVNPSGERWLSAYSNENSTSWQRLGYLMEGVVQEIGNDTAFRILHAAGDHDDEDDE